MAKDEVTEQSELWSSPPHGTPHTIRPKTPRTPKTPKTPTTTEQRDEDDDPDAALKRELEGVRGINESLEGVLATLERAGGNMNVVAATVGHASTLLSSWTRILSQTEHNQRLLLNPAWKGTTEDQAEQEAEVLRKRQAAERRAAEAERREELRRRQREEQEEKQRAPPTRTRSTRAAPGVRGTRASRARAASSAAARAGTSYLSDGPSTTSSRGTSGIGRGIGSTRGRGRGAR
ncbi:DASH complex subunit Duo1-domain-containing protein [Emericellopsis atlantica]|uniref:DASH complex subunit DUO1 n=1 Tax=Emericellopsis atlantica TaxID=2614577 RepID=A0A9P7ZU39_9HYPO|nr:DASH complex subunit Duo1-domain-containing protein [Emericellopsis atlantica]KAG9257792.1 DASH complex subunit Duo1-domain-containing protein [Emericellopsis atlantica]